MRVVAYSAAAACALLAAGVVFFGSSTARTNGPADDGNNAPTKNDPAKQSRLTPQQIAEKRSERTQLAMKRFHKQLAPFFRKYCYECHGPETHEKGIAFHRLKDASSVFAARKVWDKVFRVVNSGAMPPKDHSPRPTSSERRTVTAWINEFIVYVDCRLVDHPGRVTIRRLNRAEYNNTIRDLLGVDFQPARDFPSDDVGYGFDNIGDVLSLPPLLMEKYLDAAEQIAAKVILTEHPAKKRTRRDAPALQASGGGGGVFGRFRTLSTNGEVFSTFELPATGKYRLRAEAAAEQAGNEPAKMELRLDGKAVQTFAIKGDRTPGVYEATVRVSAGRHKLAAAFINDYYNPNARRRRNRDRNLAVRFLEIEGPLGLPAVALPASHRRIIVARPGPDKPVKEAAREVVAKFLPRAFRRPVSADEIDKYVRLVELAVKQGDSFERGVQVALAGILVSPHFLFRIEKDPSKEDPGAKRRLNDFELASRLSYFLWSSMPDEELFRLAQSGALHRREVLSQQVQRMLRDPKSQALVQNFAAQWLNLRILDEVTPDAKRFPFSDALRSDMKTETELFFRSVMRRDASILDFLDGRYTFLNERLAKHYGIPGVRGEDFRRVDLTGHPRAGVLTQASILTLTSNPTRTSPVKRGKWILENILDEPPPEPPPNVPPLDEKKIASGNLSLRKQMEIHRANPICASCHQTMDTLGFGFENFDAVGRWREKDGRVPVDASGELPGGSRFRGPLELVKLLRKRGDDFARCFVKKLLTFALGRGLEYYDTCTVDEITKAAAKDNYRFTTLVLGIVTSDAFLMRSREGAVP